jgi:hypothetical protein
LSGEPQTHLGVKVWAQCYVASAKTAGFRGASSAMRVLIGGRFFDFYSYIS